MEKKLIEFQKRRKALRRDDKDFKENRKKLAQEVFVYLDLNHSGDISRSEIKNIFKRLVRIQMGYAGGDYEEVMALAQAAREERDLTVEEKTDEVLEMVDTNSDGKISFDEFLAATEKLWEVFAEIQEDNKFSG